MNIFDDCYPSDDKRHANLKDKVISEFHDYISDAGR